MTLLVWWMAHSRDVDQMSLATTFRSFLNLYWMTAPLAWLYAIPFERFLSPADATTANLALLGFGVYASFLFWLLSYAAVCARSESWEWYRETVEDDKPENSTGVAPGVWWVSGAALLVWIPLCLCTQPEQALRYQTEKLIHQQNFESVAQLTNKNPESRFPPHWDPPPRPAWGEYEPPVVDTIFGLVKSNAAPWFVAHYQRKLRYELGQFGFRIRIREYSDDQLEKLIWLVSHLEDNAAYLGHFRALDDTFLDDEDLSEKRRSLYLEMLDIGNETATITENKSSDAEQ